MVVEYAQILSTAHRVLDGCGPSLTHPDALVETSLYRATHRNHPSSVWARGTEDQYSYLYDLFSYLSSEYSYRYGRTHASWVKSGRALLLPPRAITGVIGFTDPPQCMPDEHKRERAVDGYRAYYIAEKSPFAKYTNREPPEWLVDALGETNGLHRSNGSSDTVR